jgi:hypothetical protein
MTVRRLNDKVVNGSVTLILVDMNLSCDREGHRNDVGSR